MNKKIIKYTEGKYLAGDDGHIYCYSTAPGYAKRKQPICLSEYTGSRGYEFVAIILNGKKRSNSVHKLICTAFHGEKPKDNMCCRHLDGNKSNNKPMNLTWGTYSENEADKRRHGTLVYGEKHVRAKLSDEAVKIIRASIPFGLWNSKDAAEVFGVSTHCIMAIARGKYRNN